MASKQLTIAIFESAPAAEAAVDSLKAWDDDDGDVKLKSLGIISVDDGGKLKVDKVGRHSTYKGAGIGILLAMATPIGLAAGVIGGGALGALHHKGIGISDEDRDRLAGELTDGKAAVGVVSASSQSDAIAAELSRLGGAAESHELDDAAVADVEAAAPPEPATADAPAEVPAG